MLIRVCPSFTAVFGDAADVTAHSCVVGGRSSPGVGGGLTGNGDGAWSASWSFAHTVPPPFMSTSVQDGEMTGCRDPVWRPQRSSDRKAEPPGSHSVPLIRFSDRIQKNSCAAQHCSPDDKGRHWMVGF
jgi:hypothetical protein